MSAKVIYKDIALGADENATVTASASTEYSNPEIIPFGVINDAIATLEPNGWGLTHEYKVRDEQPFAFWSEAKSGTDCIFSDPPTITLTFTEQFASTGLTIRFAVNSNDYCCKISVEWWQNGAIKANETYYPDKALFVINRTVDAFDKIVIVFEETTLPKKRCKVESILIGVIREFNSDELKSVSPIHEIDLISATVPINVLDAEIHSKEDIDFIFQKKQPVEAYNGTDLIGVYYIEKGTRKGRTDYSVACNDAIGLIDLVQQPGVLWLNDTPLETALATVCPGVDFEVDAAFATTTVKGYIAPGKQRDALQQIAFAIGSLVDTTGSRKVRLFPLPTVTASEISQKETYTGGAVETGDVVTGVSVTGFDIVDARPGDKDESIEINEVKYKYTKTTIDVDNPNTVTSDPENIKVYDKNYLVNSSNAQAVADRLMLYHRKRKKYTFSHILRGQEVGEKYSATQPWGDTGSGVVRKMSVTMSGITVSNTEMLLD